MQLQDGDGCGGVGHFAFPSVLPVFALLLTVRYSNSKLNNKTIQTQK
jgi:hypothetical protein